MAFNPQLAHEATIKTSITVGVGIFLFFAYVIIKSYFRAGRNNRRADRHRRK